MPEQLELQARLHPDKTAVTAGGVSLNDLINEAGVCSSGALGGTGGFGVFTQGTHINHASHPMPGGIPCPISDQL